MKRVAAVLVAGAVGMMWGCARDSFLEQRTQAARAAYGNEVIPVTPRIEQVNPNPLAPGSTMIAETHVTGKWKFTVPVTVTQVEKRTADYNQYSLYEGRPGPEDTPFLVITTTRNRASVAMAEPEKYRISGQRQYVMNGGIVEEWTGLTNTGAGFCEMIVRKPGTEGQTGDVCHAIAVVKTEEQRKLALGILESIVWQANR